MGRKRTIPLAKSDFPLYCSRMIGEKHLLVAGGGGSAKTGIPNAMDIYELKYKEGSLTLHKVNHYQTKSRAVMNCDVASQDKCFYLATGMEDSCSVHILRYKVMVPKVEKEVVEGVRKRKNNFTNSTNHNMAPRMVGFEIEPLDEIITDKSLDGGFQKVVRFTQDLKCFVTGGAEGTLRCWEFPSLSLLYEVQSHSNEIDDLDCSPDNKYVVTVSKDNNSVVWKLKDGSKHCQLIWVNEHLKTHRFRCCRFARIKDKENAYCLLTTHIPIARDKSRVSSFVSKWDGESFRCLKLVNTGSDILSAMAISNDGVFFGVGTISGSVSVYISFSLQRLYHVQSAHKIFVTGLEFTPTLPETKISKGADEFTMFSISADNQIVAHQMETEASYNVMWVLLGACLLIFLIVWILNIFDLFEILEYFHL